MKETYKTILLDLSEAVNRNLFNLSIPSVSIVMIYQPFSLLHFRKVSDNIIRFTKVGTTAAL